MQTIKCFEIFGNTDTTEGRGPMKVVARFSNRQAAEEYVLSDSYAKWCVMGVKNKTYDLKNIKETSLTILDTCSELVLAEGEELKRKALAKLTDEEHKVLGLT